MYRKGLNNPDHRYVVATNEESMIVGHSIYLLRRNEAGTKFGYLYTRYVLPAHRGRGLGGRMLDGALDWFKKMNAEWAEAHTHPSNTKLQNLFSSPWLRARFRPARSLAFRLAAKGALITRNGLQQTLPTRLGTLHQSGKVDNGKNQTTATEWNSLDWSEPHVSARRSTRRDHKGERGAATSLGKRGGPAVDRP